MLQIYRVDGILHVTKGQAIKHARCLLKQRADIPKPHSEDRELISVLVLHADMTHDVSDTRLSVERDHARYFINERREI